MNNYRKCNMIEDKLCKYEDERCGRCGESCTGLVDTVCEHGELVDYNTTVEGALRAAGHLKRRGHPVYYKDGRLAGIVDYNHVALWYVDADTVHEIFTV